MKSESVNRRIGINEWLEDERPEDKIRPYKEVFKEHRDEMLKDIKDNGVNTDSEFLPGINAFIEPDIKTAMKTKSGYRKSFAVVEATVNGNKKVVVFQSFSLARQIMRYIKETYESPRISISYIITQM